MKRDLINSLNKIKKQIQKFKNKKVLFFCIGNRLKGDDGVGEYIYEKLIIRKNIYKINAGNAPVNYIGKVEKILPDIVIIIDCVNSGKDPGTVIFTESSKIYSSPIDTHSGLINEFIKLMDPSPKWYILGIQPLSLADIEKISDVVKNTADELIKLFNSIEI